MTRALLQPARRTAGKNQSQGLRLAAIDVGTNSIHMVVAEGDADGHISTLSRMKEVLGLGKATFTSGRLAKETLDHAVAAMARFHQAALQRQCETIVAVATSAVREAANGGEFLRRVERLLHLNVRIVSGREEARLIYLGVRQGMRLSGGPHLILDIGGGSVEFIVGDHRRPVFLESRKLGAARMTATYVHSDPIKDEDREALLKHFDRELTPLCAQIEKLKPVKIIGTSGTMQTIAAMVNPPSTNGKDHPQFIEAAAFRRMLETLLASNSKTRAQMPGLDGDRKDQIVAGALLLDEIFRRLRVRRIEICGSALREGIVVDYLQKHLPDFAIREQIPQPRRRSVIGLARRCAWDRTHSEHVAELCTKLFDGTRALHGLGDPARELIEYAALLHDIGWHIGRKSHHKHSMYLIQNGELKNFTAEEVGVIANIARYHRKSGPKLKHAPYAKLSVGARRIVNVGAALLRIADGLDRSHASVVRDLRCRVGDKEVRCTITARWDAALEIWGANRKSKLFETVMRKPFVLEINR